MSFEVVSGVDEEDRGGPQALSILLLRGVLTPSRLRINTALRLLGGRTFCAPYLFKGLMINTSPYLFKGLRTNTARRLLGGRTFFAPYLFKGLRINTSPYLCKGLRMNTARRPLGGTNLLCFVFIQRA